MTTAAQQASPGVYVSDDVGLEVTDGIRSRVQLGLLPVGSGQYGLRVVSSDGTTVIIDGTSDMFKIAATGTTTATRAGVGNVQSTISLTGLGLSTTDSPSFTCFITEGVAPAANGNRNVDWFWKGGAGFVAPTSAGSPVNGGWYARWLAQGISNVSLSVPQIILNIDSGEPVTTAAAYMRYYIFTETAI